MISGRYGISIKVFTALEWWNKNNPINCYWNIEGK